MYCRLAWFRFFFSLFIVGFGAVAPSFAQTFYSMRFSATNLRTGNTVTHPILAQYWQRGTPFEILSVLYPDSAYQQDGDDAVRFIGIKPAWFRVRDFEGQTGWIKSNQLTKSPTLMVIGTVGVNLYADASSRQQPIAVLPRYLVMRRLLCNPAWCQVRFTDSVHGRMEGWVQSAFVWGSKKDEDKKKKQ